MRRADLAMYDAKQQHTAGQEQDIGDRRVLLQQVDGPADPGGQAAAADLDAGVTQPLVLPVQGQVVAELVDQ